MLKQCVLLACGLWAFHAAASPPAAQPQPLPPLPDTVVEELPPDPALGVLRRQQAVMRLAPLLEVRREATTPVSCPGQVQAALNTGAYQVFIERKGLVPILAPMAYDFILRDRVDPERITMACEVAERLIIAQFPTAVRRSKDPVQRDDYVQVLFLATWAQTKADGKGVPEGGIPPDVSPDPFGVLVKP